MNRNELGIDIHGLTVRYRDVTAIDDLTLSLDAGKIYGLLGRNGAGKSTLLSVLAAYRRPSAGTVRIDDEDPFENPRLMPQISFIRENVDTYETERCDWLFSLGALRPTWDAEYAEALAEKFKLPMGRKRVGTMSRGQKAALGCVLGLASRTPVTIFDEPHLGMDAPSRYAFYEELLADYMRQPRTIIISTHLIEEVSSLFEEVVIIDDGRLVAHEETERLRSKGATITGPADAVDTATAGMTVLGEKRLGRTKQVTVFGPLPDEFEHRIRAAGLDLGPVALQDLFIHLTADQEVSR